MKITARTALIIGTALALLAPGRVHALATEHVGNKPIEAGWGFDPALLTSVNTASRVYWYEVNGNPYFFFRGGCAELQDALKKFAAIPADKREIILLAGPAETKTFDGKTVIKYDWCLHVPAGLRFQADDDTSDDRATLTIQIPAPRAAPPANPAQVRKWIAELDATEFKTREAAAKGLADLGASAGPALRTALKTTTKPEARDRIEKLLGQIDRIELDGLAILDGLLVIGVEELLARNRKALSHKVANVRGRAAIGLADTDVAGDQVLPDLLKVLESDKDEYVLRCAVSALANMGPCAKSTVATLKEQMKKTEGAVLNAYQQAIDKIEKDGAKELSADDVKKREIVRNEIAEFVKARNAK
jgi:HEAT repeat protein